MVDKNGVGAASDPDRRLIEIEDRLSVVSNLSPMQRRFLVGYLYHGNATQAYLDAGYKDTPNARKSASRLRHSDKIKAAIDEFFFQEEMSAAEVVARLSQQASAGYAAYLRYDHIRDAVILDLDQLLADGKGHLIKEVSWQRTGQESAEQVVKFYDAYQALVQVGRYHDLWRGDKGGEDDPVHHVHQSLDEWREERQRRRQEAAETLALFEAEGDDEAE